MLKEKLERLHRVEEEAALIVDAADRRAAQRLTEVAEEIARLEKKARAEAGEKAAAETKKAKKQVDIDLSAIEQQGQAEIAALRESAEPRIDRAAALVVRRVTEGLVD
jgi:hypothetical protein